MRLGDLDALKKSMCELCHQDYSDEPCEPSDCVFYNAIENAPTIDAVPVVRCRECSHSQEYLDDELFCLCFEDVVPLYGYCYKGERKETDHEQ